MEVKHFYIGDTKAIEQVLLYLYKKEFRFLFIKDDNELHIGNYIIRFITDEIIINNKDYYSEYLEILYKMRNSLKLFDNLNDYFKIEELNLSDYLKEEEKPFDKPTSKNIKIKNKQTDMVLKKSLDLKRDILYRKKRTYKKRIK